MSPAGYVAGVAALVAVLVVLGAAARRVRPVVAPDAQGPLAAVAGATLVGAALAGTGLVLGGLHLLRPLPTLIALLAIGGIALVAVPAPPSTARPTPARIDRVVVVVLVVAGAAVLAQWAAHTGWSYDGGITQLDSLYYHGPYSARFLQEGALGPLDGIGTEGSRAYPLETELLHAMAALPFHRDLLSPALNLGFAALAATGAWAVGQRHGAGSLSLMGALVALSFPALVATQAGQTLSDIAAGAFLVSAAALLLAAERRVPGMALAGLAAGLAVAAKVSVAGPVAVLSIGVLIVCRRSWRAGVAWAAGLVAPLLGWGIRNWVQLGSPVPWFDLRIGPIGTDAKVGSDAPALLGSVTDGARWRSEYLPAVATSMGRAWPLMLGAVLLAMAVLIRRGPAMERVVAIAVVASLPLHVITPQSGDPVFRNNLRFLHPSLLLGGALAGLVLARLGPRARRVATIALGVLVATNLASPHVARVPRWPAIAWSVAAGVGAVALLGGALLVRHRWAGSGGPASGRALRFGAAAVVLAALPAGWVVQRHYVDSRYLTTDLDLIALYQPFHDVHDARVAVLGSPEIYPMYGPELDNEVEHLTVNDRPDHVEPCLAWRRTLSGRYDYVVIAPFYVVYVDLPVAELEGDPAATLLARDENGAVFRLDGDLDTTACRA